MKTRKMNNYEEPATVSQSDKNAGFRLKTTRIKAPIVVPMKDEPNVQLTEEEATFCREHNFWPGMQELKIHRSTPEDQKMVRQLRKKCGFITRYIT